jgi:hypothetical protein
MWQILKFIIKILNSGTNFTNGEILCVIINCNNNKIFHICRFRSTFRLLISGSGDFFITSSLRVLVYVHVNVNVFTGTSLFIE